MDLPPTSGPVIVNTTIILIDIFEVIFIDVIILERYQCYIFGSSLFIMKRNIEYLPSSHVNTTTSILLKHFMAKLSSSFIFPNQVHPQTFTLDLSLYIKLAWADNRIELSNGSVNVDQSFMGLVCVEIHRFQN